MAEGLLRRRLAEQNPPARHQVQSAGTWAANGEPASKHAIAVMAERGIDISSHESHPLAADLVAEADLILTMAHEHARLIRTTWPQYAWKVFLLSEMAGKRREVEDPYGGRIEDYRVCADALARHIDEGLPRILELI